MLNRKILLVDDNEDIHNDFRKILVPHKSIENVELAHLEDQLFATGPTKKAETKENEKGIDWDYKVDSAFQGQTAIEMVDKAAKEGAPYAMMFMDIRMPPGLDGIQTVKRIWEKHPYIEVVLCTAYSDYNSNDLTSILGASHRLILLKKPFDPMAVRQMALAITTKWNFEAQTRLNVEVLENAVKERTKSLSETVLKLTHMNEELDSSLKKLAETQSLLLQSSKMSALGEMAAGVAHEINNPLAIIHLLSSQLKELILDEPLNKQEIETLSDTINSTTIRISKITNGLRSFSRDGTNDPFKLASMKKIIEDTLGLCSEKFKNNGIELQVSSVSESLLLECREIQLGQVLLNLLNNSYDAVEALPEKWIKIEVQDLTKHVELKITDSGSGISEDLAKKIFQPFFTTKEIGRGTGLGLSVSKGIMEAHEGSIEVDFSNKNTCFILKLAKIQSKS